MPVAGEQRGATLLQVDCAPTAQLALGFTGVQYAPESAAHSVGSSQPRTGVSPVAVRPGPYEADSDGSVSRSDSSGSMHASSPPCKRSLAVTGELPQAVARAEVHRYIASAGILFGQETVSALHSFCWGTSLVGFVCW